MSTTLLAYHGKAALKTKTLQQLAEHREQDQIIQGTYWSKKDGVYRGCAVGCLTHKSDGGHELYETKWGIPVQLAHLEDGIFEALPAETAKEWPQRFMNAIPVGADLSGVWPRFAIWLMIDPTYGLEQLTEAEDVKAVCRQVAAGYEAIIEGTLTDEQAEAITRAAITPAASAARAARAPWDAWDASAARAARAPWDAWASRDAWDAWDARAAWDAWASRDAWASWAWDAWASRDAFVIASSDELVRLLETAPVPIARSVEEEIDEHMDELERERENSPAARFES